MLHPILRSSGIEPILSAVQLLWIHFQVIVGTFAALALATDPGSPVLLNQKPDKKPFKFLTINVTKQILGQSYYQSTIIIIFHVFGSQILGFHRTDDSSLTKHHSVIIRTLVFNVFVFAQIFKSFNCRRLDQKLNVFEGMWKNWYFMAVVTIEVVVQVLICSVGGSAFGVTYMGAREWVVSLALASVSLPLGALIRLIPNEPSAKLLSSPDPEPLAESRR
ncbi:cation-transporting P-type ATPase [Lactarius hengduanensis]|nr:cation-transporting P-type ATPase [Lactarius hengduanensis]